MSDDQKRKPLSRATAYISATLDGQHTGKSCRMHQRTPQQRARLSEANAKLYQRRPQMARPSGSYDDRSAGSDRLTLHTARNPAKSSNYAAKAEPFEYLSEEFCISEKVIRRELEAVGFSTARIPKRPGTQRPGFWA